MQLYEERNDIYLVDLHKPELDDIRDDRPVSIRDALVFLEQACFNSEYSNPAANNGEIMRRTRA